MPLELQVIRASDFLRLGPEGHFDLESSKAVLVELAAACHKRGIDRAMLDLRALHPGPKPVFSPTDLAKLVNTFREIGFTHRQRLAVLYSSDPHHRARMFAFISNLRGWHVAAFGDFEEALVWLSDEEKTGSEPEQREGEQEIPLKVHVAAEERPGPKTKIRLKPETKSNHRE
jgi:hypothetical protein